ncbi:MAG: hypothetical protein LBQ33_06365, partial [Oscillospiraceae bacterium]|nr:hypothetical protein [Oscillospiraceae bacterium]
EEKDSFCLRVPLWERHLAARLEAFAEGLTLDAACMFTVLQWQTMLAAMLKLQAGERPLPDGLLAVRILGGHGEEETLLLAVEGGEASVRPYGGTPELTLTHGQALRFFFAPYAMERLRCKAIPASWFPLPLALYGFDKV